MDEKKASSLLSFLNLLSSELGLEDFQNLKDAQQIVPILVDFVKTGQLKFIDAHAFDIRTELADIQNATGNAICSSLNLESVEEGDLMNLAKLFLTLIYSLRISHNDKFDSLVRQLGRDHHYALVDMINALDDHRHSQSSSPLSHVLLAENGKKLSSAALPRNNLQIFSIKTECPSPSKPSADEEASKYKIKSTELESRLKQVEALNTTLNEQLSIAQSEYSEMEHKYESLKSSQARKQEMIEELQAQLKETIDESEMMRYENSQLQRDLKGLTERSTKTAEKLGQELKGKESEMNLLYRRLDDYVKQLAAKESLENRVKFLDQQMSNQQGIQRELRDDLEKALNRANMAETELASLRKQLKSASNMANSSGTAADSDNLQNDVSLGTASVVSLHDELNSTMFHSAIEFNGLNSSAGSELNSVSSVTSDELALLRTRVEMLEREKRELKKIVEEGRREIDSVRSVESQAVMDKALEIERLKQEREALREEFQKLRQKDASNQEKYKTIEGENEQLRTRVQKLEESLDKAANVIEEYSTASEKHCSAAELLQIRHELARSQEENQLLLNKMDQFKHEATQEQRLITTHWYNAHMQLFKMRHGLASTSNATSSNSIDQSPPQCSKNTNSPSTGTKATKSFLRRQFDTSTTSTRSWLFMFLFTTTVIFCYIVGLTVDINYEYDE